MGLEQSAEQAVAAKRTRSLLRLIFISWLLLLFPACTSDSKDCGALATALLDLGQSTNFDMTTQATPACWR